MTTIFERVHATKYSPVIWGLYMDNDGEYLVVTPSMSKAYKTLRGAMKCATNWNVFSVTEKTDKYFSLFNLVCAKKER